MGYGNARNGTVQKCYKGGQFGIAFGFDPFSCSGIESVVHDLVCVQYGIERESGEVGTGQGQGNKGYLGYLKGLVFASQAQNMPFF